MERLGVGSTLGWATRSLDRLCDAIHDDFLDPPLPWLRHCVGALELVEGKTGYTERAA